MRFDLVIFDCDGVLVDSETISHQVLIDSIRELGVHFSWDEAVAAFAGRSMKNAVAVVERRLGRPVPPDFVDAHQSRLLAALAAEVEAISGIEHVLDVLTVPYCVASSGEYDKMRTTLGRVGLLERFDGRMFSAVDVAHGKPAPDLFLHAARHMGTRPDRCVVIEDTVAGVRAAVAAGMSVFAFTGTMPAAELRAAGAFTFDHMIELPTLLGIEPRTPE